MKTKLFYLIILLSVLFSSAIIKATELPPALEQAAKIIETLENPESELFVLFREHYYNVIEKDLSLTQLKREAHFMISFYKAYMLETRGPNNMPVGLNLEKNSPAEGLALLPIECIEERKELAKGKEKTLWEKALENQSKMELIDYVSQEVEKETYEVKRHGRTVDSKQDVKKDKKIREKLSYGEALILVFELKKRERIMQQQEGAFRRKNKAQLEASGQKGQEKLKAFEEKISQEPNKRTLTEIITEIKEDPSLEMVKGHKKGDIKLKIIVSNSYTSKPKAKLGLMSDAKDRIMILLGRDSLPAIEIEIEKVTEEKKAGAGKWYTAEITCHFSEIVKCAKKEKK